MMQSRSLYLLVGLLSVQSFLLVSEGAAVEEKNVEQSSGSVDAKDLKVIGLEKQLQSMNEVIYKLSMEMSLLQNESVNQKHEAQRVQREREIKEQQMRNQLNAVSDENGQLHKLLQQLVSIKEQSVAEPNISSDSVPFSDIKPEINLHMDSTGGVTYVRWGRTNCESPAYLLYSGYATSGVGYSPSTTTGGSTDIICLHSIPQYENLWSNAGYSFLLGLEYEFDKAPFSAENNGGASFKYNDMPCAVCHISSRSHQFMLSGRSTCPGGWTREYGGYLASTSSTGHKSSLICLDEAPESVAGGLAKAGGSPILPIEARCVAIHCPPYKTDYEITCAVCSK